MKHLSILIGSHLGALFFLIGSLVIAEAQTSEKKNETWEYIFMCAVFLVPVAILFWYSGISCNEVYRVAMGLPEEKKDDGEQAADVQTGEAQELADPTAAPGKVNTERSV